MPKSDVTSSEPWWKRLSAGLVTGAADDDPSGVATYSQVGAKFGYATLWTLLLALPLMIGIQMVSALIGRVTGKGLADNMVENFPRGLVWGITTLLIIANVINIGADLGAMGAAVNLLVGGPVVAYAACFAILSTFLQVRVPFCRYAPILKFLALSLLTYVATVLVVKVHWGAALKGTFIPAFQGTSAYATAVVAILGTTISPYLFCWQAAQEVEEVLDSDERRPLKEAVDQAPDAFKRIAIDTSFGMLVSNVVAFFIILTAAVVLHAHGKTDIQSSSEAAEALKPVAGRFAFTLFSMGIIGTGLLAVPVLAGATAYFVAGTLRVPYGLEQKPKKAKVFYGVLIGSMVVGALLNMMPIDPVKALFWSAVVNGLCAVPMMMAIMVIAQRPQTMGTLVLGPGLRMLGWAATLVMGIAAIVMFATMGKGG